MPVSRTSGGGRNLAKCRKTREFGDLVVLFSTVFSTLWSPATKMKALAVVDIAAPTALLQDGCLP